MASFGRDQFFGGGGGYLAGIDAQKDIAQTELLRASTAEKVQETALQQRLMTLMQEQAGQPARPVAPSARFTDMSMKALSAGGFKMAGQLIQAAQSASGMEKNQAEILLTKNKLMDSKLGGATDQATFDEAIDYIESLNGPSPMRGMPYSPGNVQRLRNALQTSTNQALITEHNARTDQIGVQARLGEARIVLTEAQTRLANERKAQLGKTGKGIPGPKLDEEVAAQRIISSAYPDMDESALKEAGRMVASRAKALQQKNHALDNDTAARQAFRFEDEAGSFVSSGRTIMGVEIPGSKKTRLDLSGRSPANALPITPELLKSKEYLKGKFYFNPATGIVGQWTGKGLRPVDQMDRASQVEE